ncbi:MAG: hypothetical protein ETSY2_22965 [Candidatus Entotheonella gemina]|uniref:Glycosyltransferase subfamily 4-like N-terminal domain-containing protein n=1 Tax=Candidatus Entotheonella gemina TaxID=1429439 RepID=W4M728_9BACT|nr:MAG: hypothetical protein ETSY2_22965 [Candidatus Entotheonella gemina]
MAMASRRKRTMPNLLIVSPYFPPANTPDMHRVRLSLGHYASFGWRPAVLAIDAQHTEGVNDPLLLSTLPAEVPVQRVHALPITATQRIGVGNAALRALPFLYRAGKRIIKTYRPDLVFISTTQFPTMALGRLWKQQYGVPYVLDLQDPWVYDDPWPGQSRPGLKHRLMRHLHRHLEPWTMRRVDGIMAVTDAYHQTLRQRYPWIPAASCSTIPFGTSQADFDIAAIHAAQPPRFFHGDGLIHGLYAGALGPAMHRSCEAICMALKEGLKQTPALFSRLRLHFVGTDYAMGDRAVKTIEPIASRMQLGAFVQESPQRLPYFATLNLLRQADFLLVPGSSQSQYTASKIYPYILAHKPLLALFHEDSDAVEVLRQTRTGEVVTFSSTCDVTQPVQPLVAIWTGMLRRHPAKPRTDWTAFSRYTARELTRQQCHLFDHVIGESTHAHVSNAA